MAKGVLRIKDNPNPKANIGFICFVPLHFYVYKNIYKHLSNAEFIIGENYDLEKYYTPSKYLQNLLSFFSKKDVYWRFINSKDEIENKAEFYNKYALLVSALYREPLGASYNQDKKFVRVMYGHAKDPWNFGLWSAFFDLILSYGPYSQKFLSIYGNSTIVGNPKFDDWFLNNIDRQELKGIKKVVDPTKKTILYLPTYGLLSSLESMATAINKMSAEYNIIIKVHHNIYLYEEEKIDPYRKNPRIIIKNDADDILPLLKVADVVLSDNSGAIFDAILADRPIVLIDMLNDTTFEMAKKTLYYIIEGKHLGVVTSKESLEQVIKVPGKEIGPIVRLEQRNNFLLSQVKSYNQQVPYKDVIDALKLAEQNEKLFRLRRKKIRDLVFSYNDGRCGKRAAEKIKKLLYQPKPPQSFLADAIKRSRIF